MFLALDIGNTNITIGLFNMQNGKVLQGPLKVWRMFTIKEQTSDEYATMLMDMFFYSGFDAKKVTSIGIASVVPSLNLVFEDLVRNYFGKKAFFINHINSGGIAFNVPNPKEVGADRIADAAAAYSMYGGGCVIIDFGTATTFDCIDEKGRYIGGAIAPGPAISAQSLSLKTAQLPQVEMKKTLKSIGNTTVECIQSGLYFGYIGLVKELLGRIKNEMELKHIIATGGLADLIVGEIKEIEIILPNLTLEGIRIIWERSANVS
ncbi:type III pantothenate kinase [Candidatus Endomicrobiellum devescovinae]|jgi:type III pantothenate kinase|uniref:type III pantothenate kinase n=1 Tax=Candidatus Endomicrobiellum devescovinae TaxID=3242322 RepID=UPI002818D4C7|nr:type III pantothenate kinase [Endomicrobium sp.]